MKFNVYHFAVVLTTLIVAGIALFPGVSTIVFFGLACLFGAGPVEDPSTEEPDPIAVASVLFSLGTVAGIIRLFIRYVF